MADHDSLEEVVHAVRDPEEGVGDAYLVGKGWGWRVGVDWVSSFGELALQAAQRRMWLVVCVRCCGDQCREKEKGDWRAEEREAGVVYHRGRVLGCSKGQLDEDLIE